MQDLPSNPLGVEMGIHNFNFAPKFAQSEDFGKTCVSFELRPIIKYGVFASLGQKKTKKYACCHHCGILFSHNLSIGYLRMV